MDTALNTRLTAMLATFSGPQTRRITDYLRGFQLGPENPFRFLVPGTDAQALATESSVEYWGGDLLPSSHPKYPEQVKALRKSFNFRNVTLEGVETLVDGIGIDEPDWSYTVSRDLDDGEKPTETEAALIAELEAVVTTWWDRRDLPTLLLNTTINALAHGRQPVRPRIPARYSDPATRRLTPKAPERSLDGLFLTLPDVGESGIYTDPNTLEQVGLTRVQGVGADGAASATTAWELTQLDADDKTVITTINGNGEQRSSDPLDLGGLLWLLELRFPRGVVTRDVLTNQDALNVALTSLNRNTRWAAFEKTIAIGVDPARDADGKVKPMNGPGSEAYLQPSVATETEDTGQVGADGRPVTITRERMYPGASVTKLDPADPVAIETAIDRAEANIYAIMRQRFMKMADLATASGRSREVATGPYLRATARYAATVEAFIRDLLMLVARVSAIVQGQPGKYDGLRPTVTCRQKVFEPDADQISVHSQLQKDGVISMQRLRNFVGAADGDAEQAQIDKERATAPPTSPPAPAPGPAPGTPAPAPTPVN